MLASDPTPHRLRSSPFSTASGLEVVGPGVLRGPRFRRLVRGVYQDVDAPLGVNEKIRAMRLLLPSDAVLGGLSAAWALGVHLASARDPVEIVSPVARRRRPGLVLRADDLTAGEVMASPFGPVTGPERTAFDLARAGRVPRGAVRPLLQMLRREARLRGEPPVGAAVFGMAGSVLGPESPAVVSARVATAVARVDAVLKAYDLDASVLSMMIEQHPGLRGLWSARLVAALVDPRADSPPESVLRVRLVLAGLPRPVPQYEIFDDNGIFVAKPDLGWPELELGAEYDGVHHEERSQVRTDKRRDIRGHRVRWRLLHFDSDSLRDVPQLVADTHAVMLQQMRARD